MGKYFLQSTIDQLQHYKSLADKTFLQIKDDAAFFWHPSQDSNNIWILVKHLHGNMMSRYTDILTTDGEKTWRQRDEEFLDNTATREEIMQRWEEGWKIMFETLANLSTQDLHQEVLLKGKPISLFDQISQASFHYIYHVGQIIYIGKMAVNKENESWEMLWGPKKK